MTKIDPSMKQSFILILFILLGSFLASINGYDAAIGLPAKVNSIAQLGYYLILFYLIAVGMMIIKTSGKLKSYFIPIYIAYALLLVWAIVSFEDILRYLFQFLCVAFVPLAICNILKNIDLKAFVKIFTVTIYVLILINGVFSLINYPLYPRIFGIYSNPNLMGMILFSQLCLFLYFSNYTNAFNKVVIPLMLCFLIVMTGSRLSTFVTLLPLAIFFLRNKIRYALPLIVILTAATFYYYFFISSNTPLNLDFRAFKFSGSVDDSGRSVIWERAYSCIRQSPLVGHGMNGAEECVLSGNVHNSYLRVLVMLGIPLAIIFYSMVFIFIGLSLIKSIDLYIKTYLVSLLFLYFAEDYIAGVGTPFFAFFLIMLGLVLYESVGKKTKRTVL